MFLHGNGAHADWWSFIAPFFAADYRVAALSWSGMGGSAHRSHYTIDHFVAEAMTVAEAEGLFDSAVKPVFVGHSFGVFPLMNLAVRHGERLRAAVMVDTPVHPPGHRSRRRTRMEEGRAHRVYPTLAEALARFRFAPEQPCITPYVADFIARGSLREVEGGWTWKFDPFLWRNIKWDESAQLLPRLACPFALIWGDRSILMPAEVTDFILSSAPAGSPGIVVPDAAHHVMIDQPLAFVAALRALLAGWPDASSR
jgi:pimeloyl-ACP methyl ester carboxylesterase